MMMPKDGRGASSEGDNNKHMRREQQAIAIAPNDHILRLEILHRTTNRVKFNRTIAIFSERRTKIKFLISLGETRTLLRDRLDGSCAKVVEMTGSKDPPLTTMLEGTG
jgi:hypothetical protein